MKKVSRIKKLRQVLPSILFIAVFSSLLVRSSVSSPGATIYLDPAKCSGWVDPNLFSHTYLQVRVSDVENAYNFQVYITWNPAVLSIVGGYEGNFFRGNPAEEWESSPWDYNVLPQTDVTGESVGTGDGTTTFWYLDHTPVKPGNEFITVYLDGTDTADIPGVSFVVEHATGKLTISVDPPGPDPPGPVGNGVVITADYTYFSIDVDSPSAAIDTVTTTHANLSYGVGDAYFIVGNFSREDVAPEDSKVVQVDLNVRYSATASASSDQYRLVYWVGTGAPSSEVVLTPWTSAASSLQTHTWTNIAEPTDGTWEWDDLSTDPALPVQQPGLHVAVQTDTVGGDTTASIDVYEVWATVTFTRPTFFVYQPFSGYAIMAVTTLQNYPSMSGSGLLGTFEFKVIATGNTALNIDYSTTYLTDPDDVLITPLTKLGSQFYEPIPEDINGDGRIDIFDLSWVGINYMASAPFNPPQADCYPQPTPDGVVNIYDLAAVAIKYGYVYL